MSGVSKTELQRSIDCLYDVLRQLKNEDANVWRADPVFSRWLAQYLKKNLYIKTYYVVFDEERMPRALLYNAASADEMNAIIEENINKRPGYEWSKFSRFVSAITEQLFK